MSIIKRSLPIVLIIGTMIFVYFMGWHNLLSFESLRDNREILQAYLTKNPIGMSMMYFGIYVLVVTLSLPGATIATIAGGFLFGHFIGTSLTVLAATVGATIIFLVTKYALGDMFREKFGSAYKNMEAGFQENQVSYLLTLRLVPLFPFFIVNLVPALFNMSLISYILVTFIGIIPGTFVFISVGVGLGSLFDSGETLSVSSILTPEILLALTGLGLLSSFPIVYKFIKSRKNK